MFSSVDVPVDIVDRGTITSELFVPDDFVIDDVNVMLDIDHTWDSDLDVFLIAPDGTRLELFSDIGGSGNKFRGTTLDDEAATDIDDESAPFSGTFQPEDKHLSGGLAVFDGKSAQGTWTLEVRDDTGGDSGQLNSWSLEFEVGLPELPKAQVSGTVWEDLNGNGQQDPDESGLEGWTVYLDTNEDGVREPNQERFDTHFNHTNYSISNSSPAVSQITLSGFEGPITDINVTVYLYHQSLSELEAYLTSPSGTRVTLFSRYHVHGGYAPLDNTTFDSDANIPIYAGTPPYRGIYSPAGSLSILDGEDPNGTWTLEVNDRVGGSCSWWSCSSEQNRGTLYEWGLELKTIEPGEPMAVTDGAGNYSFEEVPPGDYFLAQDPEPDWTQSFPGPNPSSYQLSLDYEDEITDRDFGLIPPAGEIQGNLWDDQNGNGIRDSNEPGLAGWTVFLDQNNNGLFDPQVYQTETFGSSPPGVPLGFGYSTSEIHVSGLTGTITNVETGFTIFHQNLSSLAGRLISPSGTWISLFNQNHLTGYQVSYDTYVSSKGFGDDASFPVWRRYPSGQSLNFSRPYDSLERLNGEDPNGTWGLRILDPESYGQGEIRTWGLEISTSTPTDISTITDENGNYSFEELIPVDYTIGVDSPLGWDRTLPEIGTNALYDISLAPGEVTSDRNFGYWVPPEAEFNNSMQTADFTTANLKKRGRIDQLDDVDYFVVNLTTKGQFKAQAQATDDNLLDTHLKLYGPEGQLLLVVDDPDKNLTNASFIQFLNEGTYYLAVSTSPAASGEARTGSYHLITQFEPTDSPLQDKSLSGNPTALTTGDFDNDGDEDVAVIDSLRDRVSIYLNSGNGVLTLDSQMGAGYGPTGILAEDFTGDGNVDLLTFNLFDSSLSLLTGRGNGTFTPHKRLTLHSDNGNNIVSGHFNADEFADLAISYPDSEIVKVYQNKGNGTFENALNYSVSSRPLSLLAGDFTGNGLTDLLTVNILGVSLLEGQAEGAFANEVLLFEDASSTETVLGDFNEDGKQDLAFLDSRQGTNGLFVVLGQAANTSPKILVRHFQGDVNRRNLVSGDYNGDGHLDLAWIENQRTLGSGPAIVVLFGKGNGRFGKERRSLFRTGVTGLIDQLGNTSSNQDLSSADLDQDGKSDLLLTANNGAPLYNHLYNGITYGSVSFRRSQGDGTFADTPRITIGLNGNAISGGDFNRDGHFDLVTGNGLFNETGETDPSLFGPPPVRQGSLSILLGRGDGTFQQELRLPGGEHFNPTALAVGDWNNDGRLDVATQSPLTVFLGVGNGQFTRSKQTFDIDSSLFTIDSEVTADLDGIGTLDRATIDSQEAVVDVELSIGGGTVATGQFVANASRATPKLVDLNEDWAVDTLLVDAAGAILYREGRFD